MSEPVAEARTSPEIRRSKRGAWLRLAGLGLVTVLSLTTLGWLLTQGWLDEGRLAAFLEPLGLAIIPIYILGYALATMLWVPGAIMMVLAVSVFVSPFKIVPMSITGFVLGGSGSYFLARWLGRESLKQILEGGGRVMNMTESFQRSAFTNIILLRLLGTPNNIASYASGVSGVRWRTYAAATIVGVFPGITAGTLLGGSLLRVLHAGSWSALLQPESLPGLIAVVIVASLIVSVRVYQKLNRGPKQVPAEEVVVEIGSE